MIRYMLIGTAVNFIIIILYALAWIVNNPWLLGN